MHCAERSTEIKRVKVFLLLRGTGVLDKFYLMFYYNFCLLFFIHYEKLSKSLIEYNPGFFFINHLAAVKAPSEYKVLSKAS